jgi:hypothetical protein
MLPAGTFPSCAALKLPREEKIIAAFRNLIHLCRSLEHDDEDLEIPGSNGCVSDHLVDKDTSELAFDARCLRCLIDVGLNVILAEFPNALEPPELPRGEEF